MKSFSARIVIFFCITLLFFCSCKKDGYYHLELTVDPMEGGTLSASSGDYLEGSVVSIVASPASGYLFNGWSGSVSGITNPLTLTMDCNKSVKASFIKKTYPLSISTEGDGSVSEKVISTKSDYESGTVVELTAIPSSGWTFDHWEEDLTGSENPVRITMTSSKSVKAVFRINEYTYNIKIIGPGAVDEYLLKTKASFEHGTTIEFKALPDVTKRAFFKGWSGDLSGDDPTVSFNMDKDMNVVATFATEATRYPLPNLLLPTSVRKDIFYNVSLQDYYYECSYCALDYNQDGYVDFVTCNSTYSLDADRIPIRFYLGQPDGSFKEDMINSGRFDGLVHWRKSLYGDFNGDGVPDICFVGHGYDAAPWPGEYPVLLLSSGNGRYEETRFTDVIGFFHGCAAGDFDNDGDLDIFLLNSSSKSCFLINDGQGHFTPDNSLFNSDLFTGGLYTTELFDLNHDGYLDLIVGGHEHEGPEWHQYTFPSFVFWGNGISFNHDDYARFPSFEIGWGVTLDYIFEDLDGDGYEEIINCRTGDGFGRESYVGWKIQIVSFDGSSFSDVTNQYFTDDAGDNNASWLIKIGIEEIDGHKYLIGIEWGGNKQKLFEIIGKKFVRCDEESIQPSKYSNGLCFYSDGVQSRASHVQLDCLDDPYSGRTCMHFSNWPLWTGWTFDYDDWIDFSDLEKKGYVLEFAIKNSDPDLKLVFSFETRLQTEPWYFPSYSYWYIGSEHESNGNWELVQIPLSDLACDSEWTGYYWNTIKTLNIMPAEYHGLDFYLDEIRIRKVLQ